MLCPKCQHRNPDENRFCGQCGCDLTKSANTNYPREGYDESEFPAVSDIDLGIPRFRRKTPPLASSGHGPAPSGPYLSQSADDVGRAFVDSRESDNAGVAQERRDEKAPAPVPVPVRSQGIHGPSFLGLADPPDPDFLSDIEEPSHTRRNWLLFALALLAVLAFAEWRNLRSSGFNLNLAGTMKLVLPHKKGEQPKPAETGAADAHGGNGPANSGQPIMEVDPVNGASNQGSTQPANPTDSNGSAQQGTQSPQTGTSTTSPASNPPDQPPNAPGKSDNTSPRKAAGNQQQDTAAEDNSTSGTAGDNSQPAAKKTAAKSRDTHASRAAKSKPAAPAAGEEELARAESAGSPETAAKWLWASTSKGNLDAPVRLADMYAAGRGVRKDCEQATVLLRSSARRGNPRAAARLGMYYATGRCVDLDRAQAWHWLSVAQKGEPGSDWISQYRQRLWSEMTAGERARAGNGPTARASE